jgi:hypothetical protein
MGLGLRGSRVLRASASLIPGYRAKRAQSRRLIFGRSIKGHRLSFFVPSALGVPDRDDQHHFVFSTMNSSL